MCPSSIGYIRQAAGCRTVPVELGSRYTDEEWSQTLLTVNDFIDKYILCQVRTYCIPIEYCCYMFVTQCIVASNGIIYLFFLHS